MARTFNGSTDTIRVAGGSLTGVSAGGRTLVALIRRTANSTYHAIFVAWQDAGVNDAWSLEVDNSDRLEYFSGVGGGAAVHSGTLTITSSDGWVLVGVDKAAGLTTPRFHKYVMSTGTATHAAANTTIGNTSSIGASGYLEFGTYGAGVDGMAGEMAYTAILDHQVSDAEFVGLATSLQQTLRSGVVGMWVFDQAATTTKVNDWVGTANESNLVGTSAGTTSPPIGYGSSPAAPLAAGAVTVTGTVARTLGAFTSTASGTFGSGSVTGTVASTLGSFTSTASGSSVTGTVARTLGAFTSTASGTANVAYILSDDFPGTSIDSTKWEVYNRQGDTVNAEVNGVIPANVTVSSGTLKIDSKFEDVTIGDQPPYASTPILYHYTSGQVAQKSAPFLYGDVQVRAKICGGTGTWPCIWMLGHLWKNSQPFTANVPGHDWPNGGWWELDIAEFMQGHRTLQNCALHFITANRGGSGEKTIPFDATSRFMVYRLVWTATSLTWMIDPEDGSGWNTLLTITGVAGTDIPNTPGYLIIHTAIGGSAAQTPVSGTFPVTTEVDWARVALDATSPDNGTVNATLGSFTSTASGTATPATVTGTVARTLGAFTSAATGTSTPPTVTGTVARTLGSFSSAASGTANPPGVTGTVNATLAAFTATGTGSTVVGTSATTTAAFTSSAAGTANPPGVAGNVASTLSNFTSTATGTFTAPTATGTVSVTLATFTSAASGSSTVGAVAVSAASFTATATGATGPTGVVSRTLGAFTIAASGYFGLQGHGGPAITGRLTLTSTDLARMLTSSDAARTLEDAL